MLRKSLCVAAILMLLCRSLAEVTAAEDRAAAAIAAHKIKQALESPTEFDFNDTSLSDVIDYLASKHGIDILMDKKGLTDSAVDPSAPVTRAVRHPVRLRSALKLLLEEFDLTWVIRDDVLLITSKEKADEILVTQVYRVGDLLDGSRARLTIHQLIDAIVETVQPDSWDDNGGPGSIIPLGQALLVSQKFDCHEQMTDLLELLRAELPRDSEAAQATTGPAENVTDELRIVVYALNEIGNEDAVKAVQALVAPNSWQGQGGEGSAVALTNEPRVPTKGSSIPQQPAVRALAVRQSPEIHRKIRKLLEQIDNRGWQASGMGMFRTARENLPVVSPEAEAALLAAPIGTIHARRLQLQRESSSDSANDP